MTAVEDNLEQLLALYHRLIELAQTDQWDEFARVYLQCSALESELEIDLILQDKNSAEKALAIRDLNHTLQVLAKNHREKLSAALHTVNRGDKANKAYQQTKNE